MEFKFASEDEVHARQKFHARTRLGKALQLARNLDTIAKTSSRVNILSISIIMHRFLDRQFDKVRSSSLLQLHFGCFLFGKEGMAKVVGTFSSSKVNI